MHPEVVQNQEHLLGRILDQGLKKLDELVAIECLVNDHPARLSLVGDGGDHRKFVACAADYVSHGRLPFGLVAPGTHIGVDHRRLISPVNLCILGSGLSGNDGVLLFEPLLYGLRTLLASFLDRFLWDKAPALEVLAHGAQG